MSEIQLINKKNQNKISLRVLILFFILFFVMTSVYTTSQITKTMLRQTAGKNMPPKSVDQIKQKPPLFIVLNTVTTPSINFEILNADSNHLGSYNDTLSLEIIYDNGPGTTLTLAPNMSHILSIKQKPCVINITNKNPASPNDFSVYLKNKSVIAGEDIFLIQFE